VAVDIFKKKYLILLWLLVGCSPKYEVVQMMGYDQYHLIGVKNFEIIIINTKDSLQEGQIIRWKEKKIK
tara:strand:- start:2215 stop:2421 length:207 start_codon:yes stop_codon:yes gene_type:complete